MPFLKNEVYEAGLGGFRWRDSLLLEAIKSSDVLRKKAHKRAVSFHALILLLFLIPLLFARENLALIGGVLLGLAGATGLVWGVRRWREEWLGWAAILFLPIFGGIWWGEPNAVTGFPLSLLIFGLGVWGFEGRNQLTLALLGTSLAPLSPFAGFFSLALAVACAYKTGDIRNGAWLPRLNKTWEPINLPLGFNQVGLEGMNSRRGNFAKAKRVQYGSIGERKTALLLKKIASKEDWVAHDFLLPGADSANIDHLLITSRGVFLIDSKDYAGKVFSTPAGNVYQNKLGKNHSLNKVENQMLWAMRAIRQQLGGNPTIKGVVLVHSADLEKSPLPAKTPNIAYVEAGYFEEVFNRFKVQYTVEEMGILAGSLKSIAPGLRQNLK